MKIKSIIALSMISLVAKAEMGWVTTPFFTTPKNNKIELKMFPENIEQLKKQCLEFEKRLSYESSPLDPLLFDKYRKTDYLADDGQFRAMFIINNDSVSNFLETNEDKSKLPFYLQKSSSQQVILERNTSFSKRFTSDSYTQIAKNLNLSEANINIVKYKFHDAFEVRSKDLACDFLNQKLVLNASAMSVVQIANENKEGLLDLYINKIQSSINESFNQEKTNSIVRAALLGFKLSKTFSESNSESEVESNIRSVFNMFFKDNMENTKLLSDTPNGKVVLISTSTEVPVDVTLKMMR